MSTVSDMTRKYWTDTMLAWAERRLAPPQMDECQRAIDEMHAECSEVRELRAALERARALVVALADEIEQSAGVNSAVYSNMVRGLAAALRQPAPAGGTSELIHEIEVNHKCKCGHWNVDHRESDDGGRRVCMCLGCDCIIDTAPAGGEARP